MSSPESEATDAEVTEEAPAAGPDARDDLRSPVIDHLRDRLGDGVVTQHVAPGVDAWVRITPAAWGRAASVLVDLGFVFFDYLSAIDWSLSPWGKSEEPPANPVVNPEDPAELEHGVTGGETRFQIIARVYSPEHKVGVHLKCDVPDDTVTVPTWTDAYRGAAWHERETHEMFGITFEGNPDLRKLYLPGDFEGFPLRKDFPLLSRHVKPWPGLVDVEAMPGEPEDAGDGEGTEG